jgi:hypothetical protein
MPNVIRVDLLPEDLQPDAMAAINAVGTRVRIPDNLPGHVILGATPPGVLAGDIGVVVGCRAAAVDGEDVWMLKLESGSWADVVCSWVEVLDGD